MRNNNDNYTDIGLGALLKVLMCEFEEEVRILPSSPTMITIEIDSGEKPSHGHCFFDITTNTAFDIPESWLDVISTWKESIGNIQQSIQSIT